jgi:hypothetical protein
LKINKGGWGVFIFWLTDGTDRSYPCQIGPGTHPSSGVATAKWRVAFLPGGGFTPLPIDSVRQRRIIIGKHLECGRRGRGSRLR